MAGPELGEELGRNLVGVQLGLRAVAHHLGRAGGQGSGGGGGGGERNEGLGGGVARGLGVETVQLTQNASQQSQVLLKAALGQWAPAAATKEHHVPHTPLCKLLGRGACWYPTAP